MSAHLSTHSNKFDEEIIVTVFDVTDESEIIFKQTLVLYLACGMREVRHTGHRSIYLFNSKNKSNICYPCIRCCVTEQHIDGLVQNCNNSIAYALELLQSCIKPSIYILVLL